MSNLLLNPPKHTCPKCQQQAEYYGKIGNYGIFACSTCEADFTIWRSFAYFSGVCVIIKMIFRVFSWTPVSDTVLVGLFVLGLIVLTVFYALNDQIWTIRFVRLNE